MNAKKTILPLIAVGGVAAALFGGGAVQTAFTSTATGTLNASTASIGTVLANGTVTLANAVPGDTGPTSSVTVTNQGSTPEALAVTFGTGSNPGLDSVVDIIWDGTDVGSLASLNNASLALQGAVLQAGGSTGDSLTVPVALMLDTSATDADANGSDTVSFTVTGTATSASTATQTNGVGNWNRVYNNENFSKITGS
jgi:hypothetical protein